MTFRSTWALLLALTALWSEGCDWSRRRCDEGSRRRSQVDAALQADSRLSTGEVVRMMGAPDQRPETPSDWCREAGGRMELDFLVCDTSWDRPGWLPLAGAHLVYFVVCVDESDRVARTYLDLIDAD